MNRVFTFGSDRRWREKAVNEVLKNDPRHILDICTGTGDLILAIGERASSEVSLTGYDFSSQMLQKAREKSRKINNRISFIEGDVASMPFKDKQFDSAGITFGIRNLVYQNSHAQQHLSEIYRVMKPGGRFVVLESSKPGNPVWRFFNGIYLRFILPYLGGILSGNLNAYRYLAKSSRDYYTIREMTDILRKAGFEVVNTKSLFLGSVMLVTAEK